MVRLSLESYRDLTLTTWPDAGAAIAPVTAPAASVRLPSLDEVARRWPEIELLLAKACSYTGCYEPVDVLRLAMAGRVGIWVCEHDGRLLAAIATEIKEYPRRRVVEILFAGGSGMRLWIEAAIASLDEHARIAGCSHVCGVGRPGWARVWRAQATGGVVISRELGNG